MTFRFAEMRKIPASSKCSNRLRRIFCNLSVSIWILNFVIICAPIHATDTSVDDPFEAGPEIEDYEQPNVSRSSSASNGNNEPFFIVSTVDGSISVLKAMDGTLVGGFQSGSPLVGPSELLSGGRRIVPGLDGRLYVSLEHQEWLLQPLEITVLDVLQTPVKTCNGNSCGIVTATKSTSLFALDAKSGRLVWKQWPNGTTIVEDDDDSIVTSTVILQREDVLLQQLSTDSGKSVWNVTLGTVQALEFGSGSGGSDDPSLPSYRQGGPYLPSGRTEESRQVLMQDYHPIVELPSIIFSPDVTSLIAVATDVDEGVHVLWKRDFETVVASAFGLQDKTWKPLTVLEDPESSGSGSPTNGNTKPAPQLGAEASKNTMLTVYRPPLLQYFFNYWSKPMSLLDRLADDWLYATGLYHRRPTMSTLSTRASRFWPSMESSQVVVPKRHTLAPLLEHHDLFVPPHRHENFPRLALPSSPFNSVDDLSSSGPYAAGVFLTWPFLVSICIVVVGIAALVFRYLYLQKKTQWMQVMQQMATVGLLGGKNQHASNGDTGERPSDNDTPHSPTLRRSHSLPDIGVVSSTPIESAKPIKRRMRSESLQISHAPDGRMVYDKELAASSPDTQLPQLGTTSTTLANTSKDNASQEQQLQPQTQGVGFLVDGIPLIRYNRYDSEFSEVVALGKGGFGTVFRCKNVLDGREYAIKKVSLRYKEGLPIEEFRQRLQRTLREVKSLALLDHPNIVRYYTAWLELQQSDQDDGATARRDTLNSRAFADSDYLLSPTSTTFGKSSRQLGFTPSDTTCRQMQQRRPSMNDCHYLKHGYNNTENPLGGWNGFDEEETDDNRSFQPFVPGIPAALDDYGFTFDRDDEGSDDAAGANGAAGYGQSMITDTNKSRKNDEKSKSLGFVADGPIIHRYSSNYSSEAESSVEGSTTHMEGWSQESPNQTDRHDVSITDTSTDERERHGAPLSSAKNPSTPVITVKHILYIQMQFCSQKTLADFLNNPDVRKGGEKADGRVDIPYALSLFLQIAQGVQHVHSQGLIHRDLKPNNCFMDDTGAVKVGDFGLSRESASENREGLEPVDELVDQDNVADKGAGCFREITAGVGTRSYASPEQMKGSDYDSSTDIYSLGIMLFELCYPMYTGMERTIVLSNLRKHIFPEQWMTHVKPAFPTLHSLLESMISNSPSARPTALVVVRSINSILEGFTISSIDKHHHENAILLRVETRPREDVLRHTMDLVKEAAHPDCIEIMQYGLRGGTNKAVMEFAISSSTCADQASLGNTLVRRLAECDEVLLIRQVSGTKYSYSH